jgi:hypothetical protein
MPRQESDINLRDWVEEETRHIDVVASWESLCDTYDALRFSDPLSDAERLEEYRWIVQQMNSFLTKMRTRLLPCKDMEAMAAALEDSLVPSGKMELGSRKALVYQKLRQQWVMTELARLRTALAQEIEMEEDPDGWQG